MASRAESKKARLVKLLDGCGMVDEGVWTKLKTELAPVSDSYLRQLLRESGCALAPVVEGVNSHTIEDLDRTLTALAEQYSLAEREGRQRIRAIVIEGKDRVRWAVRRAEDEERRALKVEMELWILTWLEDPPSFPLWLSLRKVQLSKARAPEDASR